jgi:polysaccharide chain length determinant protein (PEP-CTERM system associated)
MSEEFAEEKATQFDPGRWIDLAKRRHLQFLIPLLVGWLAVWGLSWFLPVRYKSTTLILVQGPTMPKNYVVPNITDDLQEQLQTIQQQILSRTRLLTIIRKFDLYRDPQHPMTQDQQIKRMRSDIGKIELVRSPNNQITAFRVSYSAPTPKVAQEITGELTNLFITANLIERQKQSEQTTTFIEKQLDQARKSLAQQDLTVREFESAHQSELPTQQASNLQILSGLQAQLQSEQDSLNAAKQQRAYYESLIAQYRSSHPEEEASAQGSNSLEAMDKQIAVLRVQLADLSARYTSSYPAVETVKAQLAAAEQQRKGIVARQEAAAASQKSDNLSNAASGDSAALLQLKGQLKSSQIDIAGRERSIESLSARIGTYQARLNAAPTVQQQLADLTRGYQQSQANYNDLLKKETDSKMATRMEQLQQGQRFTLLDPPSLPSRPDSPNRLKFCGFGIAAGLLLGIVVVGILEFADDRLRSNKEIEDMILPANIMTEVPEVMSASDAEQKRRTTFVGWSVATAVFLIIFAGSVVSYLHA